MDLVHEAVDDALVIFDQEAKPTADEQLIVNDPKGNPAYAAFRKYQMEAESVRAFLETYLVKKRKTPPKSQCLYFFDHLVGIYEEKVETEGFCFLSEQDSNTGHVVSYYPGADEQPENTPNTEGVDETPPIE